MPGGPLIDAPTLRERMRAVQAPAVLDVRWELGPGALPARYEAGHIPGAAFVDLDAELADAPGEAGRHPLPDPAAFGAAMRRAGVSGERPVVVLDGGGGIAAARAWWLLRYFGHPDVRMLDGGLPGWIAAGGELETGPAAAEPGDFTPDPGAMPVLDADGAAQLAGRGLLIDARAPERFRGESEPVDPVAGHIPGAVNRPAAANLGPDGRLLDRSALRDAFSELGAGPGRELGTYCGSGVSAALEVLALELAGFRAALYPGSWSEWVRDPSRPVARGE